MFTELELKQIKRINKLSFWIDKNIENNNDKFDNGVLLEELFERIDTLKELMRTRKEKEDSEKTLELMIEGKWY